MVTLFCDLPEINWFAVTYFRDQDADYLKITREITARKICDEEALENLMKISHTQIKVILQYLPK